MSDPLKAIYLSVDVVTQCNAIRQGVSSSFSKNKEKTEKSDLVESQSKKDKPN